MFIIKAIFFLSLGICFVFSSKSDECIVNGRKGHCMLIDDCPAAKKFLGEEMAPSICGNKNGLTPIICCLNEIINQDEDKDSKVKRLVKRDDDYVRPKEKHEKMCRQYSLETTFVYVSVVGGRNAIEAEFPHMALLGYGDKDNIQWSCGGVLISKKFVLTAGHCISHREHGEIKHVRLGDIKKDGSSGSAQDYEVIKILRHPDYKPPAAYNDIALLELNQEVKFNETLKPACLESKIDFNNIKNISATGWGLTEYNGYASDILQTVELDIFSHEDCIEPYKNQKRKLPQGILDDKQICAGGKTQEKDTCQGDSGGPLQWKNDRKSLYRIIGITSIGKGCGIVGVPGIYTRISKYIPWIESIAYASPGDVKSLERLESIEKWLYGD